MSNIPTELLLDDASAVNGGGAYIEYRHGGIRAGDWIRLDAGAVVKANQQVWLKSIENWHRKLCVSGTVKSAFWWLNNASRLTVWVPFDLRPILFARAVQEICAKQEHPRIYLCGMPQEVIAYLAEWECNGFASYRLVGASKNYPLRVSRIGLLAKTCLQFARLIIVWAKSIRSASKKIRNIDLLVYSTPLDARTIASKGDHFFGRVFDGVDSSKIKLEWLYESRESSGLDSIGKALHDTGRTFQFVFGYLKPLDLFKVFFGALGEMARLRLIAKNMPVLTLGEIRCEEFAVRFARQAIVAVPPVWEIALLYAFRRYLQIAKPKAVIYPYEEKGGERALILACDKVVPRVSTIAFAHAAYCHGHLYVHNSRDIHRPSPDFMAVTGIASKNWFNSWGELPLDRLKVIGSPKHIGDGDMWTKPRQHVQPRQLLFLCGIGHEISRLVDFATACPVAFAHSVLRIRKYPYSWQAQQDEDILKLKGCGVQVLVEKQDLAKEIEWADVVLFTTTSAALDAMLRSKPCIRIVDDVLDTSLLAGRDINAAVPECGSADELCKQLDNIFSLNDNDYRKMVAAQRSLAVDIFSAWSGDALVEMIDFHGDGLRGCKA